MHRLPRPVHLLARGMTLIELLVSMAIALIVIGAVAVTFSGTSSGRLEVERSGRLTENAAYAMELLQEETRLAGYFADVLRAGAAWQAPDPCATALAAQGWSTAPLRIPLPVVGYGDTEATPACFTHRKDGTAAIVLHRLAVDTTLPAAATGAPYVQVSNCATEITTPLVYSNTAADFTLHKLDCTVEAPARRIVTRGYYISTCNDCATDSMPTLKRIELVGDAVVVTPLAEGIENLQIEYGFDTDGDGNSDVFRAGLSGTAGAADNNWLNVVAVRFYLLARSTDASVGYIDTSKRFDLGPAGYSEVANDDFKRVQLTSIARLNNPAGWRETP